MFSGIIAADWAGKKNTGKFLVHLESLKITTSSLSVSEIARTWTADLLLACMHAHSLEDLCR